MLRPLFLPFSSNYLSFVFFSPFQLNNFVAINALAVPLSLEPYSSPSKSKTRGRWKRGEGKEAQREKRMSFKHVREHEFFLNLNMEAAADTVPPGMRRWSRSSFRCKLNSGACFIKKMRGSRGGSAGRGFSRATRRRDERVKGLN